MDKLGILPRQNIFEAVRGNIAIKVRVWMSSLISYLGSLTRVYIEGRTRPMASSEPEIYFHIINYICLPTYIILRIVHSDES